MTDQCLNELESTLPDLKPQLELVWPKFGAGDGIRTHDSLLGKQVRYHCVTPAGSLILGSYQFACQRLRRWLDATSCVIGVAKPGWILLHW